MSIVLNKHYIDFYTDHVAGNVWKQNYVLALSVAKKHSSQNNIQVKKVCAKTNQVCHHLNKLMA